MKGIIPVLIVTLLLSLAGCAGDIAEELYETAKLEELQNARDHAIKLYQEILEKHPDSEYAPKARERLAALTGSK